VHKVIVALASLNLVSKTEELSSLTIVTYYRPMTDRRLYGKLTIYAKTELSGNGRIVIPAPLREALGVKAGDPIVMEVEDGVLRIESFRRRLTRIQDEIIRLAGPERSLADELIAERREEARREQGEFEKDRLRSGAKVRKAG
jgi:AbrB family looped-hinge helix DNA binding protein